MVVALLAGCSLWLTWPFLSPANALTYRDIPRMVQPNLSFLQESVRRRSLPLLQHGRGPGMPYLYDPQAAVWYPGTWLAASLSLD